MYFIRKSGFPRCSPCDDRTPGHLWDCLGTSQRACTAPAPAGSMSVQPWSPAWALQLQCLRACPPSQDVFQYLCKLQISPWRVFPIKRHVCIIHFKRKEAIGSAVDGRARLKCSPSERDSFLTVDQLAFAVENHGLLLLRNGVFTFY